MERQLWIFFGKAGAGKNYAARIFALAFNWHFYDADSDLTPEMLDAIRQRREFSDAMRDRYFAVVRARARELLEQHGKVALAQALFKNRNRQDFLDQFPCARFIWVDADRALLESRVLRRDNAVTLEYARKINAYFEMPDFDCYRVINNRGEQEILAQALAIMKEADPALVF